jgi:hypothetical protein
VSTPPEAAPGVTPHVVGGPPDTVPPPPPPPPPPPGGDGAYNSGVVIDRPLGKSWWEKMRGWVTPGDSSNWGRSPFQSDTCFPALISPVTNPFFFEDPRSLTEVRPIFIYQSAPSGNPIFHGGHSEFFGTQARVAVTDRLSFVMNELGFVSLNPNAPADGVSRDTGFAEIKLGPKYTFLRNKDCGMVAAAGLTFELPVGSKRVFQDTGNLGLDPYVSFAKTFGRLPSGFGSFNFLAAGGYSFGVDSQRAEFLHTSFHLDYNVANANKIYPLLELNWRYYTKAGRRDDLGFEGGDLVNFGSHSIGDRSELSLALGARYKFSEHIQLGGAFEWPLLAHQATINDFRFTFDVIFRY